MGKTAGLVKLFNTTTGGHRAARMIIQDCMEVALDSMLNFELGRGVSRQALLQLYGA
jgi:hypothetical protein